MTVIQTRVGPQYSGNGNMPEAEQPIKGIIVYVCPTPGCPDYYAATEFIPSNSDLHRPMMARNPETGASHVSHTRTECPVCRAQGKRVDRIPYIVTAVVPLAKMVKAVNEREEKERAASA